MENTLCSVMTLTPTSWESSTQASGRCKGCNSSYNWGQLQEGWGVSLSASGVLTFIVVTHFPPHRSECSNCEVGEQCGVLMYGRAVTFCEPFGGRELVKATVYNIATTVHFTAHFPYIQTQNWSQLHQRSSHHSTVSYSDIY